MFLRSVLITISDMKRILYRKIKGTDQDQTLNH